MGPVDVPAMVVPIVFEEPGPLNVNRASAEELTQLPGIGPVLAERIVAFREAHGPFRTVDDLLAVPGIGPKTLAGFRDLITVDGD
jgi:competence protein ComEA